MKIHELNPSYIRLSISEADLPLDVGLGDVLKRTDRALSFWESTFHDIEQRENVKFIGSHVALSVLHDDGGCLELAVQFSEKAKPKKPKNLDDLIQMIGDRKSSEPAPPQQSAPDPDEVRAKHTGKPKHSPTDVDTFLFSSMSELLVAVSVVNPAALLYASIYRSDVAGSEYRLVLPNAKKNQKMKKAVKLILSEFGTYDAISASREAFWKEHGEEMNIPGGFEALRELYRRTKKD